MNLENEQHQTSFAPISGGSQPFIPIWDGVNNILMTQTSSPIAFPVMTVASTSRYKIILDHKSRCIT